MYAAIERHDRAALDNPVLASGLNGDFAGRRGRGHLESMLDPGGLVREYPIESSGMRWNLRVRVRFAFDGPVTVEGGDPADQREDAWNLVQQWALRERSRNASATMSYGGTAARRAAARRAAVRRAARAPTGSADRSASAPASARPRPRPLRYECPHQRGVGSAPRASSVTSG
ncbi:hypothetical protein [Kribbella sp. DT2]|uniref:hypothetical protein n=1 Tax=Kribbella sp. DT2 TaxID=3393427 RepID=UPI003CEE32EB